MNMSIFPAFLILLLSIIIAYFLIRGVIYYCHKYSIFDYPGRHKRHRKPTPFLGGVAIFIAVWIMVIGINLSMPSALIEVGRYLPVIFLGSIIIFLIGLIDDLYPISAWVKLLVEVAVGLILFLGGITVESLSIPGIGVISMNGFGMIISILWVTFLTNAINLIDGLDGLASGVSIIALITMVVIGINFGVNSVIVLSLIISGALFSFWMYNRYPAKIFLGDNGALLIGYFFAVISLVVPIKSFTMVALFLPLMVLGVPLTEAATSFLRRFLTGKNVMRADRRHLFHYLRYAGLSQSQIIMLFYLFGGIFGGFSILMLFLNRFLLLTLLFLFMVVIFIIYFIFIFRIRRV